MNIGLIAMSGIRVCDDKLLEIGLTLPGFVERSKVIASLPSLGLLTLAGMTPDRHHVDYIEMEDLGHFEATGDLPGDYDLVAISSYSAQIKEAYLLADEYRERGTRVVMGGLHVSCVPEEAGEHCDTVVIGEGEASWLQVLRDAENGGLRSRYGSVDGNFDLEQAPMPAFHLLDIEKYNRLTVQTSRGCPHSCEFCASSILICRKYKQKPMEKVLAEIDAVCGMWEHPFLEFADDNTFINPGYWKELLPRLGSRKVRWFTETDISVAGDDEMLQMMRNAGCAQVLIGLESPGRKGLDGIETRNNWKLKRLPEYRDAIARIQSHGISVNGCFVLGLDGHDSSIFQQVFEFVQETGLHEVQITLQTAFPGTQLYDRLKKEDRILSDGAWEMCTLFDVNFEPAGMSVEELVHGFRDLAQQLYTDEFTKQRRRRFREDLRKSRTTRLAAGGEK
jgi:radical SAM superfamily enzyme YgiQ (UPF0313 family)